MELLFTNKQQRVRTEVYLNEQGVLHCKHFRMDGNVIEFLVDNTEANRELLATELIRSILHYKGDFGGGKITTHGMRIGSKSISSVVYNLSQPKPSKSVFMIKDTYPLDYRLSNLTTSIKDVVYSEEVLRNRDKHIKRTLIDDMTVNFKKRMSADYSGKLSESIKRANRKRSNINEEIVADIREAYSYGAKQTELIEQFGLPRGTIADILYYRTWNEHEFMGADIEPQDIDALPQVKYLTYKDEPTRLRVDESVKLFACEGFVYKIQQKVDFQVYISKHLANGKLVSDVHLVYMDKPTGTNKFRNYVVAYVRGDRLQSYYMDKYDVYSLVKSYVMHIE